jgi:hypothetical protein
LYPLQNQRASKSAINGTQGGEYAEPRQAKIRWLHKKSKYAFERKAAFDIAENFMYYYTFGDFYSGFVGHDVNQASARKMGTKADYVFKHFQRKSCEKKHLRIIYNRW